MSNTQTATMPTIARVGMGQISVVQRGEVATCVLGSCVGVVLDHRGSQTAAVAHVVLPDSSGRGGPPGKFADTAVPEMIQLLRRLGVPRAELRAKLAGGANMFHSTGTDLIGDTNLAAVLEQLGAVNIPVVAQDCGGFKGRRIVFESHTGLLTVDIVGEPRKEL